MVCETTGPLVQDDFRNLLFYKYHGNPLGIYPAWMVIVGWRFTGLKYLEITSFFGTFFLEAPHFRWLKPVPAIVFQLSTTTLYLGCLGVAPRCSQLFCAKIPASMRR